MNIALQPVQVAIGRDEEGMLVFSEGRLAAVLVHLSDQNEIAPGDWYLEVGFGRGLDGKNHPTFRSLEEAQDWITERLRQRRTVVRRSRTQDG